MLAKREAKVQKVRRRSRRRRRPLTRRAKQYAVSCVLQDIDNQMALAKAKTKAKDKRGALQCLKKKKLYEKELAQLGNTKFGLEQQVSSQPRASFRFRQRRRWFLLVARARPHRVPRD